MTYQAFMSYSHAADGMLAPALHTALHRFAKPFYKLRAVHIFRDKTTLQLTDALWPEIRQALVSSEYFILFASPDAVASRWVQKEVETWLELHHNKVDKLLIVLTAGNLSWNPEATDFDWSHSDALPENLKGRFRQEPLYLDLRWATNPADLSLKNRQWKDAIATIASTLRNRPKDSLLGEDIRLHRQFLAISAVLAALLVSLFAGVAVQRQIASQKGRTALAQQVSNQAIMLMEANLPLSGLLSIEALRLKRTVEAEYVLHRAAKLLPIPITSMKHDGVVRKVVFHRDGKRVLSASDDATARMWNVMTGAEIWRHTFDDQVWDVEFSPDGQYLAAADGKTIGIWRLADRKRLELQTSSGDFHHLKFSGDGHWIAATGQNTTVWELPSGKVIVHISDFSPIALDFGPYGRFLVTDGTHRTARVFELPSGVEMVRLETQGGWIVDTAFNNTGTIFATAGHDKTARLWSIPEGKEIGRIWHRNGLSSLAFSPDGTWIATGSHDHTVKVSRVPSGEELFVLRHEDDVYDLAVSRDGQRLATASSDGTARVWSIDDGTEIMRITHGGTVYSVAFSEDGTMIATASEDGTLGIWGFPTDPLEVTRIDSSGLAVLGFINGGRTLLTESFGNIARLWDVLSGQETTTWDVTADTIEKGTVIRTLATKDGYWPVPIHAGKGGPDSRYLTHWSSIGLVTFSKDGRYLATWDRKAPKETGGISIGHNFPKEGSVWETKTGERVMKFAHEDGITSMMFSPDGRYLASAGKDSTARLWEVSSGQEIARLKHSDDVTTVVFSPDGKLLATGSFNGIGRLWSVPEGKEMGQLSSEDDISEVVFSPDGRFLATAKGKLTRTGVLSVVKDDENVRLWDVKTGRMVALLSHSNPHMPWEAWKSRINTVTFSPDGQYLATGSSDHTVRIWKVPEGREIIHIFYKDEVSEVVFSPDGAYLATTSADIIQIRHWRVEDVIQSVCNRLKRDISQLEWRHYLGDRTYRSTCLRHSPR